MSVIIGCVKEDKVLFATDTQRTWGSVVTHADSAYASNILWMPNGVAVGVVGNQAVKHGIAAHPEWFLDLGESELTKEYIMHTVIPPLYRAMRLLDELDERSVKHGIARFNGIMLLAKGNKLFCIDSDFAVVAVPDYCLVGHGYDYAVPRMLQYRPELTDDEATGLMLQALQDAETFSRMTSGPFQIGDTVTQTLTTVKTGKGEKL